MNTQRWVAAVASTMFCAAAWAQSAFEGTWRMDPERPGPGSKPQLIQLLKGRFRCRVCSRPEEVNADGLDHSVSGAALYDTLKIAIVNDHTIAETGKKAGVTAVQSTLTVSADGSTITEHESLSFRGARKLDLTNVLARVSPGPKGSHAISGTWRLTQSQLTGHEDDTSFRVSGGVLSMTDRLGDSFSAKLDGTEAPYKGSAVFTTVSVKQTDSHTLVETDKRGKQVVRVNTWTVDPEGMTMHVRFDNHGHIVQQSAHKLQ
jgi:hypothetical protein